MEGVRFFFAELDYRLHPTRATLEKWADIVQGTAENMADYPTKDEKTGIYHLAFVMPPSERGTTSDTVFDLAYWRWGLDKAQEWRQRMGLARVPLWDQVRRNLALLPWLMGFSSIRRSGTTPHTKRLGASRSDWSPWHVAAHGWCGPSDCQTHRRGGMEDLGLSRCC